MRPTPPTNSRATPEATDAILRQLLEVIAGDEALAGAKVEETLRIIPGIRGIFAGQLAGERVVFRLYPDPGDFGAADRQWGELQRAHGVLGDGPYRVNRPVHLNSEGRLLVVGFAEGTPLMQHMWLMPADVRPALLLEGVRWLRAYTASSEQRVETDCTRWISRARERASRQGEPVLREDEARVIDALERIAARLDGQSWRAAISHGDFHPNNLIYGLGHLTGIDTGGPGLLPIYKDMARYLVHFARRRIWLSGERRFGVDRVAYDGFCEVFGLDDVERSLCLPFMLGVDALQRIERKGLTEKRLGQVRKIYRGLLKDLRD